MVGGFSVGMHSCEAILARQKKIVEGVATVGSAVRDASCGLHTIAAPPSGCTNPLVRPDDSHRSDRLPSHYL